MIRLPIVRNSLLTYGKRGSKAKEGDSKLKATKS